MSSPLMQAYAFETCQSSLDCLESNVSNVSKTNETSESSSLSSSNDWKFPTNVDDALDEQMCRLIDNLAVSPDLTNHFCELSMMDASLLSSSNRTDHHANQHHHHHHHHHRVPINMNSSTGNGIRGRTDSSDSGVGDCSDTYVMPDQNQIDAILNRLETYFSDDHLRTDTFLLKHIRRSKEGFVSLKLVSSFQKMKSLTKDWRVVAHCIRHHSKALELNDTGTKVRRIASLPEDILQLPITKKKNVRNVTQNNCNSNANLNGNLNGNHYGNTCNPNHHHNGHILSSSGDLNDLINAQNNHTGTIPTVSSCTRLLEQLERRWPRILFAFEPSASLNSPSSLLSALRSHCERFGPLVGLKLLRPERALRLDAIRRTLTSQMIDLRKWRQLSALIEFASVEHAQQVLDMQQHANIFGQSRPQITWPGQFHFVPLQIRSMNQNRTANNALANMISMSANNAGSPASSCSSLLIPSSSSVQRNHGNHDTFGSFVRPRNRSDLGPLECIQFDSFDPLQNEPTLHHSMVNNPLTNVSSMINGNPHINDHHHHHHHHHHHNQPFGSSSSRLTLNDSFESFDSFNSLYSFGRPRASTISHFADWGSNRSTNGKTNDALNSSNNSNNNNNNNHSNNSNDNSNGDNHANGNWSANRTMNPIGPIARPKSNSVSTHDQNKLMHNGASNLLRLPKGPDSQASGFDSENRSRSTSSPSAIMQLFSFP